MRQHLYGQKPFLLIACLALPRFFPLRRSTQDVVKDVAPDALVWEIGGERPLWEQAGDSKHLFLSPAQVHPGPTFAALNAG